MKVKFLGHASFLLTSQKGTRIITDPYKPGCFDGGIQYDPITEEADIVTISHEHDDHNETNIKGDPVFVRETTQQEIEDIMIKGLDVFHDTNEGRDRGKNIMYTMHIDGMNVVHCGDLGHDLDPQDVERLGKVDVLLIPVGGHFTIDSANADTIINALKPKVVIPMHFKTEKCGFPIAPIEDFIKGKEVKHVDGEFDITQDALPESTTVFVLMPTK